MVSIDEMAEYVYSLYNSNGETPEEIAKTLNTYSQEFEEGTGIRREIEKLENMAKQGITDPKNLDFHTGVMVLYAR